MNQILKKSRDWQTGYIHGFVDNYELRLCLARFGYQIGGEFVQGYETGFRDAELGLLPKYKTIAIGRMLDDKK